MIDIAAIKQAATGRWPEILQNLGGCPSELLDGKHHACPQCGGKDRFRLLDEATGAVFCNQCFNKENGDGLAALSWLRGWGFSQTVAEVMNYLAINGKSNDEGRVGGDGGPCTNKSAKTYLSAHAAVATLDSLMQREQAWPVAEWTYTDAEGNPVAVVVRYDLPTPEGEKQRKTFRPVSKWVDGWRCSDPPGQWPLYQLPKLAGAKRIFVVEGEKCVEAARSIVLTTTTSAHGAKAAAKTDWSPLTGREVVVLSDHDQAGQSFAEAVVALLAKLTPTPVVKVVELPGLPAGGDIVDWIDAHGDAAEPEELRRQIEALADEAEVAKPIRSRPSAPEILAWAPVIPAWKPFPVDALPEPIQGFVAAGAKAIGCDPVMIGLPMLVALGSVIGATRRIRLKRTWTEPAVLWGAVVAESGTSKSPAQGLALGFLRRLQSWKLQEYSGLIEQYERNKVLYEADLKQWQHKGRNAGELPPEKPPEPIMPRYIVNDITIEALADRLKDSPRGLLVDCEEFAAWIGAFDQYRKGRGGDVARWLSIHRAEALTVDRKTGPVKTIFVPRAAVSIVGGIQPRTLSRHLGAEHVENGLLARLLLAAPPRVVKRWSEATVNPQLVQAVERVFGRLLALDFGLDKNDNPVPTDLPLTPDGKAVWVPFYNQHANQQADLTGDLAAAYSKIEAYAARMALVVHLVRWASDDPTLGSPDAIDGQSIGIGTTLAKWFGHEAERLYGMLAETDDDRDRRRLVESVQRKGGSMTPRDLMRSSQRYGTATEAENALANLVRAGIGHWDTISPPASGGHATRIFRLSRDADTDTRPIIPEEKGSSVGVGAVSAAENAEPIDASLAEAAAEDAEEWVDL